MLNNYLTLIFSFLITSMYAQNELTPQFEWGKQISSLNIYSRVFVQDVDVDSDGNIYATGYFENEVDFDPGPADSIYVSHNNEHDSFILKLNSQGELLWYKVISGDLLDKGWKIDVDSTGNVLAAGWFRGTANFGTQQNPHILNSSSSSNSYLVKLTTNGELIWVIANNYDLNDFEVSDLSGSIYIAGEFNQAVDLDHTSGIDSVYGIYTPYPFLIKLDSNSNYLWGVHLWASDGARINDIQLDRDENIISAGVYYDSINLDHQGGLSIYTQEEGSLFLHKMDSSGNLLWSRGTGRNLVTPHSLITDSDDNIYCTGRFQYSDTTDFSIAGTNPIAGSGATDAFIAKFTESGAHIWSHALEHSLSASDQVGYNINKDRFDNIYIGGRINGIVDFDPGPNVNSNPVGYANSDAFLMSLDSAGIYRWGFNFGGPGWSTIYATHVDSSGTIVTVGYSMNDIDLDPSYTESYTLNGTNLGGGFVQKLRQCFFNEIDTSLTQISEVEFVSNMLGAEYQWLDCSNGFTEILGATQQSFMATENGEYSLEISYLGCIDTTNCYVVDEVSSPENNMTSLNLYPNPSNGLVYLNSANYEDLKIEVMDISGKIVHVQIGGSMVDLTYLKNGMYIVYFSDGTHQFKKKIILN